MNYLKTIITNFFNMLKMNRDIHMDILINTKYIITFFENNRF